MKDINVKDLTVAQLTKILSGHDPNDLVTVDMTIFEQGIISISKKNGALVQSIFIDDNFLFLA